MIRYYLTPKAIKVGCKFEQPDQGNAGYDIYASEPATIRPRKSQWVVTGLYVQLPSTGLYPRVGLIRDRSSVAGRRLFTHAGVIDSSYRGEVKILIENASNRKYTIRPGDKIAQMIIVQHLHWPTRKVESLQDLSQTERGEDGFGSTGI